MMKNSGLKNEELLHNLRISGSDAILSRNEFGVHLFTEAELKDGVIGARLVNTNYNIDELQRSIDTSISELIPVALPELPDTVLLSEYEDLQTQLSNRISEITELNSQLQNIRSENSSLQSHIENLEFDKDNLELLRTVAENRLDILSEQLASIIQDLQYAIQKATSEAVQRVSLSARNDVVNEENKRLRETLSGRDAQLTEGAKLIGGVTVLNLNQPPPDIIEDVYYKWVRGSGGERRFYSGIRWRITNTGESNNTIDISIDGIPWFTLSKKTIELEPTNSEVIELGINNEVVNQLRPYNNIQRSRAYDGHLVFKIRGTQQTIKFTTRLRKKN